MLSILRSKLTKIDPLRIIVFDCLEILQIPYAGFIKTNFIVYGYGFWAFSLHHHLCIIIFFHLFCLPKVHHFSVSFCRTL